MKQRAKWSLSLLSLVAWLGGSVIFSACNKAPDPKLDPKVPAAAKAGPDQAQPADPPPVAVKPMVDQPPAAPPSETEQKPVRNSARPDKHAPVDLTKLEKIFVDWPKPKVALLVSGDQEGYLEPCGCAGFDNMKGGLTRRHTFLKEKQAEGWSFLGLDVGGQLKRNGKQAELQFTTTIDSLKLMGYRAVGLGLSDLRIDSNALLAAVANDGLAKTPFVSANVLVSSDHLDEFMPSLRIVEQGGLKLGITAVIPDKTQKQIVNQEIKFLPAADSLKKVLARPEAAKCDWRILLSHGTVAEATALAKQFPQFQIVVTAGGGAEPPKQPSQIDGTKTWLIETGIKGMHVGVIGLYGDAQVPIRYQRVPMDARFKESPEMLQLKAALQDQLKGLGYDGLGIPFGRVAHPSGRAFAGSESCGDCHTKAYEIWKKTPHAKAFDTLVKLTPPRHFDPECLSCHVTGWEPQKFFPYATGFQSLEKTPKLQHNGCENCHGPGMDHVKAEEDDAADAKKTALRKQMRLPYSAAKDNCLQCHDLDNSPAFDFESYWKEVEHKGKE